MKSTLIFRGRRLCAALSSAAAVLLVLAASAVAGAPITLSANGVHPQVVVDTQGTADIVWEGQNADANTMQYCQIPAGGSACVTRLSFPGVDARILLGAAAGEVVLIDRADSGSTPEAINVWVSADGGRSFDAGRVGGDFTHPNGDGEPFFNLGAKPVFGPGGFSVSWLDSGGYYEDFPDNAGPPVGSNQPAANTQIAKIFPEGCVGATNVALVNSNTPVASCEAQGTGSLYRMAYRTATGQGNINDASTGSWAAEQQFPVSGEENGEALASGPRGVYALYEGPEGNADVRRLLNGSFGPPTTLANLHGHSGTWDISQDGTGNLFAAYGANSDSSVPLTVSTSSDGVAWTHVPLDLNGVKSTYLFDARVAGCAAGDGSSATNGFVVFNANSYIQAESLGKAPCGGNQGSGSCPTHLAVGAAQLIATTGCFAKSGSTYKTSGGVELNGMMIDPSGGASRDLRRARRASIGQLVVDPVNKTIQDKAPALVQVSNIVLGKQPLDWLLPGAAGQITDLANNALPVSFDPAAVGSTVLGFGINGLVTPSLKSDGTASLPVNVQMPSPIGGFIGPAPTDDLDLSSGNSIPGGLSLGVGSIDINIPDVSLGIAELKPFEIRYDSDPSVFEGKINILLPAIDSALDTHFLFQQGKFIEGDLTANLGMNVPIFSDVFLTQVGIKVFGKHGGCPPADWTPDDGSGPSPTYIGGFLNAGVGPIGPDGITGAFNVIGDVSYTFPESECNQPGVFAVNGKGELFGVKVASAFVRYSTDGDLALGAGFDIGDPSVADIYGNVGGELAVNPVRFDLYGDVGADVLGLKLVDVKVIGSSVGIDGCLLVAGQNIGELGYKWGGKVSGSLLQGCDIASFVPAGLSLPPGFARDGHAASASSVAVNVPAHVPVEGIALTGSGGAPLVRLTGPGGQQVITPTPAAPGRSALSVTPAAAIAVSPSDHEVSPQDGETLIKLRDPQAGTWRITPLPGSAAILAIDTAKGLPAVSVSAHVALGAGRARVLIYRSTPAPGRMVTFLEKQASGAMHTIGSTTGRGGRIRFLLGGGPAGPRTILAEVTERGMALSQLAVATYTAPGPARLGRPRYVRVTRHGSKIMVSWGNVSGAARYVVRAILKDGRSLVFLEAPSRHSLSMGAVPGFDAGNVMVAGLDPANHPGLIATTRLKPIRFTCRHPRSVRGKLACNAKPKRGGKRRNKGKR